MRGCLIDQLLPAYVYSSEEAAYVTNLVASNPYLEDHNYNQPSNTLPLFYPSHLNLVNLETSATTHTTPWPDQFSNCRMDPANIQCLQDARIDYASLANNHTLDFGEDEVPETLGALQATGINLAGADETEEKARRPAVLELKDEEEGTGWMCTEQAAHLRLQVLASMTAGTGRLRRQARILN